MFRKTAPGNGRLYPALVVPVALFLAYFAAVHFGVLNGHPVPAILVLVGALVAGIYPGIKRGDRTAWLLLSAFLLVGVLLWLSGYLRIVFYLPSLLINLTLLIVFGVSLLPGNTPLITQFSRIMKGDLDAKALLYTYRVTLAWTIFFAILFAEALLLALFASPRTWSLFANFLNYVFLLLFFLVEYRVRVHLFPEVEHPGFVGFLRDLLRVDRQRIGLGSEAGARLSREGKRG